MPRTYIENAPWLTAEQRADLLKQVNACEPAALAKVSYNMSFTLPGNLIVHGRVQLNGVKRTFLCEGKTDAPKPPAAKKAAKKAGKK